MDAKLKLSLSVVLLTLAAQTWADSSQEAQLKAKLTEVLVQSQTHYRSLLKTAEAERAKEPGQRRFLPRRFEKGKYVFVDPQEWTAGFFPGSLWLLFEASGDSAWKDAAVRWTAPLAENAKVTSNHDVGFITMCSFGNGLRLTNADGYGDILRETAGSLCKRYNPDLGLLRSWGRPDETRNFLVIPDNLMNLELLEWAAAHGGESRFAAIARSHAAVTARHHYRTDGGCYHVLDYDQKTLRVKEIRRGQGASCETAWARGQSWSIYGFTMMYRFTKDPKILAQAERCADFALGNRNMPADGIPYWDYGAPGEERDASAGAIMASALLELCTCVPAEKGAAYRAFAVKQLLSLTSSAYYAAPGANGDFLIMHCVGHKPGHSEVDVPLNYADYYFLEALLRFRKFAL